MPIGSEVTWHDLECGAYVADLPHWAELTDGSERVLDLGCGSGRVGLYLAALGRDVTGIDTDPELVATFNARAARKSLSAMAIEADARGWDLDAGFDTILAPMQLMQLLDAAGRKDCLRCATVHLAAGGRFVAAVTEAIEAGPSGSPPPLPDATEVDGWVYSSLPLDVTAVDGGVAVRRLRQTVSPRGELAEDVAEARLHDLPATDLEKEAAVTGLRPAGRRVVAPTDDHVGSTVVLLEAG